MTMIRSLVARWRRWRAERERQFNRRCQRAWMTFDPPRPPDRCPTCGRPGRNYVPRTAPAPANVPPPKPRK